jgi:hypothetical protein
MTAPLAAYGLSHGWIRPVAHPELGVEIAGQSVVRYLRFGAPARIERLELPVHVAGRWIPAVPIHPAHLTVAVLDGTCWRTLRDVALPYSPLLAGESFGPDTTIEAMDAAFAEALGTVHGLDLGVEAAVLRVECDREHPVWRNHGECNGAPHHVPFGLLDPLRALGTGGGVTPPAYQPPLRAGTLATLAPAGMTVELTPWMVRFDSPRFTVAFSLLRPLILHLGWDALGTRAGENRIAATLGPAMHGLFGCQSGPALRLLDADLGPHNWTGTVEVLGHRVCYRGLTCGRGVTLDATFHVSADGMTLELTQHADAPLPVLEADAWRLAWDVGRAMTGAAAVPTLAPGRNGEVHAPMLWAGDGCGCLRGTRVEGDGRLQVESYRAAQRVVGGLPLHPRPDLDAVAVLSGTQRATWAWTVDNLQPATDDDPGEAIGRHWAAVFSCYRPEYGGFSNNAVSVNCHVNQHCPAELVAFTATPAGGPDPRDLMRFTLARALLDGGGYGFYRALYLDADPVLVSAAGRIHGIAPQAAWQAHIAPGVAAAARRMLDTLGDDGLVVCRALTGNSGAFRWSSNAMDVVGFGHQDAYVNAWTYRALRNADALLRPSDPWLAARCRDAAEGLRAAFPRALVNPHTGWVAGWRSADGVLHDAAYLWVNGVACAFGLLPEAMAREALRRLEALRHEVGAGDAHFGVPFNLRPIPAGDHMLPHIWGPLTPTFENYTDGAMSPGGTGYYLRALATHGLADAAARIAADLEDGFVRRHFTGGVGSGVEFYRWDGTPTGYEGTFVANPVPLYAIAVQRGVIHPTAPEWWPG